MKSFRCHSGYDRIALKRDDGEIHNLYVHRAVALAWHENPEGHDYVDHIDRNRLNNNVENLRWVNASMNSLNRTMSTTKPRYIRRVRFNTKKEDNLYWVIDVRNSILNYRKRFLCSDFTLDQVLFERNKLMHEFNIPVTD
jgi:hypothetical protein